MPSRRWPNRMSAPWAIAVLLAMVIAVPCGAQHRQSAGVIPTSLAVPPLDSAAVFAPGGRSVTAAVLLSGLLPLGTGSFYAGHWRHGLTHLAVGALSFSAAVIGGVGCIGAFGASGDEGDCSVAEVGGLAFVVNWVWNVVSAANDARAYNRGHPVTGTRGGYPDAVRLTR